MITEKSENVIINDYEIVIDGIKGKIITIIGVEDVKDPFDAHSLSMIIKDISGNEIHIYTGVTIGDNFDPFISRLRYYDVYTEGKSSNRDSPKLYTNIGGKKTLSNAFYYPNKFYRFKKTRILNENDKLIIKFVGTNENPMKKILKSESSFKLECDIKDVNEISHEDWQVKS